MPPPCKPDSRNGMTTVEICVDDEAGAAAAISGGAHRIELCAALEVGGLTPSTALLRRVLARAGSAGIAVHAMVRPRAGDFDYAADELALAIEEGRALLAAGADGLVFGACRDGALDLDCLSRWRSAFDPATSMTLHRAIDLVADPVAAVGQAASLGFARILSSGGARSASAGTETLRRMVEAARDRCRIAAGAGIRADNVAALVAQSGVDEVHASASVPLPLADERVVALGFAPGARRVTDAAAVTALCRALMPHEPK